jgi:PKD repeat protein
VDIDGEAWASSPTIGCDEFQVVPITGPLTVSITATFTNIATGFRIRFTSDVFGHATANRWEFGDGTVVSNRLSTDHLWNAGGSL